MEVGKSQQIKWTPHGSIVNVRVEYKSDTGSWNEVTPGGGVPGSVDGLDKTWSWDPVADAISDKIWIRVSDDANQNVEAISAATNVIKGQLTLKAPDVPLSPYSITDNVPINWSNVRTIGN